MRCCKKNGNGCMKPLIQWMRRNEKAAWRILVIALIIIVWIDAHKTIVDVREDADENVERLQSRTDQLEDDADQTKRHFNILDTEVLGLLERVSDLEN